MKSKSSPKDHLSPIKVWNELKKKIIENAEGGLGYFQEYIDDALKEIAWVNEAERDTKKKSAATFLLNPPSENSIKLKLFSSKEHSAYIDLLVTGMFYYYVLENNEKASSLKNQI